MSRWWPRDQQRKYKEERHEQAARVADRLLGKKKVDPDVEDFFGGTRMQMPIQYSLGILNNNPRTSFIISVMEGI